MLILTRNKDEQIMIGDDIVIKVMGISRSGKVRIGVQAPKNVPVHRSEVYRAIKRKEENCEC